MRNEGRFQRTKCTISWYTCSRCGALAPRTEHSTALRFIDPGCCGLPHSSQPNTLPNTRHPALAAACNELNATEDRRAIIHSEDSLSDTS
jgi:hypothetical protein